MTSPLQVASVPYLVGRPLDLGLEHEPGIDFRRMVPALQVEGLRAGTVDVALVSSIELFRQPGYRYLDRFAVAGRGAVGSVQVFLRRRIEEVRSLALDPASRAARALVQVLLHDRPGGAPAFIDVPAGLDPREVEADAWLRIGDLALREHLAAAAPVFNPSQVWTERSGLPFIFAAWIVRPGVDVEHVLDAFVRARQRGRDQALALADEAATRWDLPVEACRHYLLEECEYEPGDELTPALNAFGAAAVRAGLADPTARPRPIALPVPLP